MVVLLSCAFTIDVPSSLPHLPPEYGRDPPTIDEAGERNASTSFSGDSSGFRVGGQPGFFFGDWPESSSSIGTPDDNDDDVSSQKHEEEEEAESTLKVLGSLDSLEDSLPIKRGLSSHFSGKSKSFTDLSQVSSVKDLQKQENPLNKRRRVQIASRWSRRSSFYAYSNPKSMPLDEDSESEEEEEEEEEEEKDGRVSPSPPASSSISAEEEKPRDEVNRVPLSYAVRTRDRRGGFKSRSLSLADLQEHDEEEKDDDD